MQRELQVAILRQPVLVVGAAGPLHVDDGALAGTVAHDEIGDAFELAAGELPGQRALRLDGVDTRRRELPLKLRDGALHRRAKPLVIAAPPGHQENRALLRHDRRELAQEPGAQCIAAKGERHSSGRADRSTGWARLP
jgi:hypothetical protein